MDFFLVILVIPAVLGLTAALILAVTACFCARRIRRQQKKSNPEAAFPFQPPRPPRAVRSPSGASHYLKKSPSPTANTKPFPGHPLSPSSTDNPPAPQTTTTKYTEEVEIPKHAIGQTDLNTPDQDQPDNGEYGKLGNLVFKLRYLADRNALVVSVVRCRGLPARNSNGALVSSTDSSTIGQLQANGKTTQNATDPYVKLQLLPDKQHKVKTR